MFKFTVGTDTALGCISIALTPVSPPTELLGVVLANGALIVFIV